MAVESVTVKADNRMNLSDWLGLLFVGCKLCHQIDWSWWWVTAPFWFSVIATTAVNAVKLWRKKND